MLTWHLQIILRINMFLCAGNHLFFARKQRTCPWPAGTMGGMDSFYA